MKFYSTKKNAPLVDFKTALFQGIAPDGGLYMPETFPQISLEKVAKSTSLHEVAFMVMRMWMDNKDISDAELKPLIKEAFSFPIPLVSVGNYSILELFHGPTMAFKDIAGRILARLFEYYLEKEDKSVTILVATSGDTGGAIAQACSGLKRVKVVVLYPKGKVSELQREQLARVGDNIISIAVDGVFDDCQAFVKKAFNDPDLQKFNLSSANSINVGRLLPQIISYVWAYQQLYDTKLRFVVPSGNMGNVTAALFALRMGLPIDSLVVATNENDVAVNYYKTGVFKSQKSVKTLSTAMDIGNPSNFERILSLFQYDHAAFRKMITAVKVSDKETVKTIKSVYQKNNYLMDFHTAVGYGAAENVSDFEGTTVVVSTASPIKFAKELKSKIGIDVDNSDILKNLRMKEKRVIFSPGDYEALKKIMVKSLV